MYHNLRHKEKIELHFWLNDNSHSINAFVLNHTEHEFLAVVRELAKVFKLEIEVEAQAYNEGGLISWFRIIAKSEDKQAIITTSILTAILTALLASPIIRISDKLIDKLFEDKELVRIEKETKELELEKLKLDIKRMSEDIENNTVISKRRSNFYESLDKYERIEKISFTTFCENKSDLEYFVNKEDFKNFILVTDDLEPELIDDAIIEIMSPVLKKGKHKWWGFYEGVKIPFTMQSNEFKTLVQMGVIEFKNGSSINCLLEIIKTIDNEGNVKVKNHTVKRVNKYFQNDNPIETNEGRIHRNKLEAKERQMRLF